LEAPRRLDQRVRGCLAGLETGREGGAGEIREGPVLRRARASVEHLGRRTRGGGC